MSPVIRTAWLTLNYYTIVLWENRNSRFTGQVVTFLREASIGRIVRNSVSKTTKNTMRSLVITTALVPGTTSTTGAFADYPIPIPGVPCTITSGTQINTASIFLTAI